MIRYSILFIALVSFTFGITGCTSKTKISPGEAKAQAFDLLNEEIRSVITDPARANDAADQIAKLEKTFRQVIEDRSQLRKDFVALSADYDAPKEAFVTLANQIEQDEDVNRQKIAEIRAELVRIITADEWAELAKSKQDAFSAGFKALQAVN